MKHFKMPAMLLIIFFLSGCTSAVKEEADIPVEKEAVSEVNNFPNYVTPIETGGVCTLYGNNFRISGEILSNVNADSGIVTYTGEAGAILDIRAVKYPDPGDVLTAVKSYVQGEYDEFLTYLPEEIRNDTLNFFYYSVDGESYMNSVFSQKTSLYYSVVPCTPSYLVVSSAEMFYVTLTPATVIFEDPSKDPMTYHTRSLYEETAVANTIMALEGKGQTGSSTGTADVFNTDMDRERRSAMLAYNKQKWMADGTSTSSSDVIDTTSPSAKASQWVLKATSPYSYVENGLKLHSLYGTKSSDNFSIQGTVDNLFGSERPWVIVIKYLDADNKLLALHTLDYTQEPIAPNGTGNFSYTLSEKADLMEIVSVQFEIY